MRAVQVTPRNKVIARTRLVLCWYDTYVYSVHSTSWLCCIVSCVSISNCARVRRVETFKRDKIKNDSEVPWCSTRSSTTLLVEVGTINAPVCVSVNSTNNYNVLQSRACTKGNKLNTSSSLSTTGSLNTVEKLFWKRTILAQCIQKAHCIRQSHFSCVRHDGSTVCSLATGNSNTGNM